MRTLTNHVTNGLNEALRITVLDEPGQGGACHEYLTDYITTDEDGSPAHATQYVVFQNGPVKENGVNGTSQEALLAILIDRLRGFQSGQFACPDNAEALAHLEGALAALNRRTNARVFRGVEGTNVV
jgi:hypothetical protein